MIFWTPEHTTDEALRYIVDSLEAGIGLVIAGETPQSLTVAGAAQAFHLSSRLPWPIANVLATAQAPLRRRAR